MKRGLHMPHEKEKVKGRLEQAEGKVKEEVGKLGGDTSMQVGGVVEQGRGKVREGIADVHGKIAHEKREPDEDVQE
jgi:uncharacterized protein YjbJ (UPF0337 family)